MEEARQGVGQGEGRAGQGRAGQGGAGRGGAGRGGAGRGGAGRGGNSFKTDSAEVGWTPNAWAGIRDY